MFPYTLEYVRALLIFQLIKESCELKTTENVKEMKTTCLKVSGEPYIVKIVDIPIILK